MSTGTEPVQGCKKHLVNHAACTSVAGLVYIRAESATITTSVYATLLGLASHADKN